MLLASARHTTAAAAPTALTAQRSIGCRCPVSAPGRRPPAPARRRRPLPPAAILDFLRGSGSKAAAAGDKQQRALAVQRLLGAIEGAQRGLNKGDTPAVLEAVAELKALGEGSNTTDPRRLEATWKLLWTTEQETLFILEKAGWFGTAAGDVFQVISLEGGLLQNVITFPPEGAFVVDSSISVQGPQRTAFQFTSATLQLPGGRRVGLPPFGKGWFDTVYCDDSIRVAQDSRGDTLVVQRDGPPRRF